MFVGRTQLSHTDAARHRAAHCRRSGDGPVSGHRREGGASGRHGPGPSHAGLAAGGRIAGWLLLAAELAAG